MRTQKRIVELKTRKKVPVRNLLYFKNISKSCNSCFIIFKPEKCSILVEIDIGDVSTDEFLMEQVALGEAEIIADIISWEYNIPLRSPKIYPSNSLQKLKYPSFEPVDTKFSYRGMLSGRPTRKTLSILSGYRQVKNENSRALRYLMHYRLLEIFAKEYKGNVDSIIKNHRVKTPFVKDKRNPKFTKSLITHFRDKIHPTKPTYQFPSKALSSKLDEIERVVRIVIADTIKGQLVIL